MYIYALTIESIQAYEFYVYLAFKHMFIYVCMFPHLFMSIYMYFYVHLCLYVLTKIFEIILGNQELIEFMYIYVYLND